MATLGIHNEILKIAQTYGIKLSGVNPYTGLSSQDISTKWDTVSKTRQNENADEKQTRYACDLDFFLICCMDGNLTHSLYASSAIWLIISTAHLFTP